MKYNIGIYGNSAESELVACSLDGVELCKVTGDTIEPNRQTSKEMEDELKKMFLMLFQKTKLDRTDCVSLCIGCDGIDNDKALHIMNDVMDAMGISCPRLIAHHCELTLWAELEEKPGIALLCNSRQIAYGKNSNGDIRRVGGWGALFDDMGSDYWIACEGLRRAYFAYDKREMPTLLTDYFCELFDKCELTDCLDDIYRENLAKDKIAEWANVVRRAAKNSDEVSIDILKQAGEDLFSSVETLTFLLGLEDDETTLVIGEKTRDEMSIAYDQLERFVRLQFPQMSIRFVSKKPVDGAIYLSRQLNNSQMV